MAYLLAGERPARAPVPAHPLAGFFRWLAAVRTRRARRLALQDLLELDAALLADLGISREDVFAAMRHPPRDAGEALAACRARNDARPWPDR
ncbi:hypothetical protein [Devosia sp.]|uniref:hypothetical protein n=1 Tax=Devosia sp. TaxID=1871048 RepID=UPI002EEDD557